MPGILFCVHQSVTMADVDENSKEFYIFCKGFKAAQIDPELEQEAV